GGGTCPRLLGKLACLAGQQGQRLRLQPALEAPVEPPGGPAAEKSALLATDPARTRRRPVDQMRYPEEGHGFARREGAGRRDVGQRLLDPLPVLACPGERPALRDPARNGEQ